MLPANAAKAMTVVARITDPAFRPIGQRHPGLTLEYEADAHRRDRQPKQERPRGC